MAGETVVHQWQTTTTTTYGRTLKTDPTGGFWTFTQTQSQTSVGGTGAWPYNRGLITNADQGVLMSWTESLPDYCAVQTDQGCQSNVQGWTKAHLTGFPGGDAVAPDVLEGVHPALQLEDGSYVGSTFDTLSTTTNMVHFDASGNILGYIPGYLPQMATADGGVVGVPYQGFNDLTGGLLPGSAVTFDASLNTTGLTNLPTQSWQGDDYQVGSIEQTMDLGLEPALSFAANLNGNPSSASSSTATSSGASSTAVVLRRVTVSMPWGLNQTPVWQQNPDKSYSWTRPTTLKSDLDYVTNLIGTAQPNIGIIKPRLYDRPTPLDASPKSGAAKQSHQQQFAISWQWRNDGPPTKCPARRLSPISGMVWISPGRRLRAILRRTATRRSQWVAVPQRSMFVVQEPGS